MVFLIACRVRVGYREMQGITYMFQVLEEVDVPSSRRQRGRLCSRQQSHIVVLFLLLTGTSALPQFFDSGLGILEDYSVKAWQRVDSNLASLLAASGLPLGPLSGELLPHPVLPSRYYLSGKDGTTYGGQYSVFP